MRLTSLRIFPVFAIAVVLSFVIGCDSTSKPSEPSVPSLDAIAVAKDISSGVGIVRQTSKSGAKGPVFVFEEVHTSRVGQLQIAVMLLRLHDRYNVKAIGLEGSIWSGRPLEAGWYRSAGKTQAKSEREDLAVRMVSDGEISSSELMTMLFEDSQVYGVEDAGQYQQSLDVKGSPEIEYLLAIAEHTLTPPDQEKVLKLIKAKKQKQAFDYMLTADPWVKEQYESLKTSATFSSEKMLDFLHALQSKAAEVGAEVEPKTQQSLENEIRFMQTASDRSGTMVDNLLQIPGLAGQPLVLIVGAAHSDKVAELLAQKSVSFALVRPADLDSKYGAMSVAEYERKDKGEWARNSPGTLGYVLNARHKPPPIIERPTGHSYASMNLAGMMLARSARAGGSFPDDVLPQIADLPGVRIDRDTIARDGHDVLFRAWLKQDDGSEKAVWARVGTRDPKNMREPKTLEDKLVVASDELKGEAGGGGDKGGRKGGKGGGHEGGEHDSSVPGDLRRGKETVSRIGMDTLVSYASTREEVSRLGHISD